MLDTERKFRPRVTVWHHEVLPSDAKKWSRGTDFSIRTKQPWFFFLHTVWSPTFDLNVEVAINESRSYIDICHMGNWRRMWRPNDVNFQRLNDRATLPSMQPNILTTRVVIRYLSIPWAGLWYVR